jgi:AcrR family transcriptional regulator
MQVRRTNEERAETTRAALIAAARGLFVEKGYADTATPEIVAATGLTRGALYHHFADKQALFRAVVEAEAQAVAIEIDKGSADETNSIEALLAGARAFISAMQVSGRTRLLLLDGPAVLGRAAMDEIDGRHGARTLKEGLQAATEHSAIRALPLEPLVMLLSAMFDRAALVIAESGNEADCMETIEAVLEGLRR